MWGMLAIRPLGKAMEYLTWFPGSAKMGTAWVETMTLVPESGFGTRFFSIHTVLHVPSCLLVPAESTPMNQCPRRVDPLSSPF